VADDAIRLAITAHAHYTTIPYLKIRTTVAPPQHRLYFFPESQRRIIRPTLDCSGEASTLTVCWLGDIETSPPEMIEREIRSVE
jgi:hypothetical protein